MFWFGIFVLKLDLQKFDARFTKRYIQFKAFCQLTKFFYVDKIIKIQLCAIHRITEQKRKGDGQSMKAKKLLAVLLSLAMIATMFPVVVFGADEPSDLLPTYRYDFGLASSPVMAGWTPVTINAQKNPSEASSTMYSADTGYGLLSPISSMAARDRSSKNYGANQMERDWIGCADWKFQADVKPGTYNIIVYCTDMLQGRCV